jgi:hypothetical protein
MAQRHLKIPPVKLREYHRRHLFQVASRLIEKHFDGVTYCAVVHGSLAEPSNVIFSDMNIMLFVDGEKDEEKSKAFAEEISLVMQGLGLGTTSPLHIPYSRSLLVPRNFAESSAIGRGLPVENGAFVFTRETVLDVTLRRLILNVLTAPHIVISGDEGVIRELSGKAEWHNCAQGPARESKFG